MRIFQHRQSTGQHISLAVHMCKQGPRCAFHLNCNYTIYLYTGYTINWEIFVFKNFHAIIFHVKIFSYAYENILTTKMFLQREFRVQRYTYVETHGRAA